MEQFPHDQMMALSTEDFTGQRASVRDSLMLTANFRIAGKPDEIVRVRNLSSGGMMAEYTAPIGRGTVVQLELRGVGWISGRIAWATDGRVGVAFDSEIDPMLARKPVGNGTQTPVFAKAPVFTKSIGMRR